jgi:hypothetical protein
MGYALRDGQLKVTKTLNSTASSTIYSGAIDLEHGSFGDLLADVEFKLTVPALNATMAPDTRTFTYSIVTGASSDLSSTPTVVHSAIITQTGASSAGAATNSVTFRLPVDCQQYVGVRCVTGASTGDASSVSLTFEALL